MMAHPLSVSQLKAKKGRGIKTWHQKEPRPGTRTRRVYDRFMRLKGIPITGSITEITGSGGGSAKAIIEHLNNTYGLDIRYLYNGKWVLAGEWFGTEYVDYIARRI